MLNENYGKNLELLINKVDGTIDIDWEEATNLIGADIHPDSLRKAFATTEYGGYHVAKYLLDKKASELADETINKLQEKKDDEYKERVRLQDARREYNNELRAEARYEYLVEILKDSLKDITPNDVSRFNDKNFNLDNSKQKYAILQLSDWHYGAICDSQWNFYDTKIAEQRAEDIIDKTIRYILSMKITDMAVEINGDMVEGMIHIGNRVASEESVVEQIINVSKILARCINSLKPYLNSLKVVTTMGNHGRLTSHKKDQSDERENFEMLIPEFLRLSLDKDISIVTSQGLDFVKYELGERIICLAHGHHDKMDSAINNMIRIYKTVPDEVHLGHTHHISTTNDSNIHVVVNGSLKGADDFGIKATRCITKPSQNLIVYGEDRILIELVVE